MVGGAAEGWSGGGARWRTPSGALLAHSLVKAAPTPLTSEVPREKEVVSQPGREGGGGRRSLQLHRVPVRPSSPGPIRTYAVRTSVAVGGGGSGGDARRPALDPGGGALAQAGGGKQGEEQDGDAHHGDRRERVANTVECGIKNKHEGPNNGQRHSPHRQLPQHSTTPQTANVTDPPKPSATTTLVLGWRRRRRPVAALVHAAHLEDRDGRHEGQEEAQTQGRQPGVEEQGGRTRVVRLPSR